MCGLFGVINLEGKPVDKNKALKCSELISHRGPDDAGVYYSHSLAGNQNEQNGYSVILTHRRLSIIDLSDSAHQPMTSADQRYTIIYNGEIYNFREIKKNLINNNFSFRTDSDTEVILKLYIHKGKDCVNDLRGMFAFVIWDDKEKKVFAARDRFGIKPFYYSYNNKEMIFSSEVKPIKYYSEKSDLSMQAIDAFLRTGSVPAPLTIYESVSALLPGHFLEADRFGVNTSMYWHYPGTVNTAVTEIQNQAYDEEAKQIVKDALLDTVKAHLVSDVEVGAFLSGGIDSTAIVSLMRQAGKDQIRTISVTFPGSSFDESFFALKAAGRYSTNHFSLEMTDSSLLNDLDNIFLYMDQPTIDGVNTWFVSKAAAAAGLKVVMSGVGGDELFGGYSTFYQLPRFRKLRLVPLVPALMKISSKAVSGFLPPKAIEFMNDPLTVNAEYRLVRGLFSSTELRELGWTYEYEHPFSKNLYYENSRNELHSGIDVKHISMLETSFYMRNQLLRDSDVFSMAHSLELRVPFADHKLYQTVYPYLKSAYNRHTPKHMLVTSAGDIPSEIVKRPKMGFTFPFFDWMKTGRVNELITETINSSGQNFFKRSAALSLTNKFHKGRVHWSRVWALFVLCRFFR